MDKNSQNILLGAAGGGYVEPPGQQLFEPSGSTSETFTWVCPPGVRSISVVAVGGGAGTIVVSSGYSGGPGGGLGYANNIPVVPDKSYKVRVGGGGRDQNNFGDCSGGDSFFAEVGVSSLLDAYVYGGGAKQVGTGGPPYSSVVNPGTYGGTLVSGGGNGGNNGAKGGYGTQFHGGGGGAGGYSGYGGAGGTLVDTSKFAPAVNGSSGSGGGGGGGSTSGGTFNGVQAAGGGGVGLLGQGSSGAGGIAGGGASAVGTTGGRGGSGGDTGPDRNDIIPAGSPMPPAEYGGGARSSSGNGGNGGLRIIWPGDTRQFPSTNTGDV